MGYTNESVQQPSLGSYIPWGGERLPAYLHPRKGHFIYSLLDMSLSPSPQMSKLTQSWSAFTGRTSGIVLSSTWWKICFKPEVITLI